MKKLLLLFLLFPLMVNGQIIHVLEEARDPACHYPDFKAAGKGTPLTYTWGCDADFYYKLITRDSTVARAVITMAYSTHKKELVIPDRVELQKGVFFRERDDWGYPNVYQWVVDSIDVMGYGLSGGDAEGEIYDDVVSLKLPETIKGIRLLYGTKSLESFHLPSSVKTISEEGVFLRGCPSLTSLSVGEENTVYDSRDNCNALIKTATNTLIKGCSTTQIPSTVEVIGEDAFVGCSMSSIEIPLGVKVIENNAFRECKNLSQVEIPASVSKIGGGAFWNCENLSKVTFSEGIAIDSIFNFIFDGCPNMKECVLPQGTGYVDINTFAECSMEITCLDTTPPKMTEYDFYSTEDLRRINGKNVLFVPSGCKEVYQNAEGWRTFGVILEIGEEVPSDISTPKTAKGKTSSYSLSGYRLSAPLMQKGLYIKDGKKLMTK